MSGFVALVARGDRLVDAARVTRVVSAAPFRGGAHVSRTPGATLAGLGSSSAAPVCRHDLRATIVFDGRIDNRRDLAHRLGLEEWRTRTDAALALAAYERWGRECPVALLGDFAFAVWDGRRRELFCARDPLGVKPLYYAVHDDLIVAASDLLHVLAALPSIPRLNEGMIGEYLANTVQSQDETVYDGIYRLRSGHGLTVCFTGHPAVAAYWQPGDEPELDYASDAEYAEEFRELFTEAVRCRLPAAAPAALYLSGGIDSAAVTAVASSLAGAHSPVAFSLALGDDPERHELRYMRDVSAWCGVESLVTRAEEADRRPVPPFNRDPHDSLRDVPAAAWKDAIRARGFSVALTGQGGDAAFFGSQYHYADLLRRGKIRSMWRQWQADAAVLERPARGMQLVQFGAWPLLPRAVRRRLSPIARRAAGLTPPAPEWIHPDMIRRVDLDGRLRPAIQRASCSAARDEVIRGACDFGWRYLYQETAEREAAERGLEERHPFLDRRVVDFALRLPDEQRWRGEITRFVVRAALADRLPPSIRTRRSSGDGSSRVVAGIEAMGGAAVLGSLAIAEAGWVRQDMVTCMYRRMRERFAAGRADYAADAQILWILCGTELWFRRLSGGLYFVQTDKASRWCRPEVSHYAEHR